MINSFFQDQSPFRNRILLLLLAAFLSAGGTYFLYDNYAAEANDNAKLSAQYEAEGQWLRKFDYKQGEAIQIALLKPIKKQELESVQTQQLNTLKSYGLSITSVKNVTSTSKKKQGPLPSVKTTVTVNGTWENLVAALNTFEKKHLVVITDLHIQPEKQLPGILEANFRYSTYYK